MTADERYTPRPAPPGLTVREALPEDNDALIKLEVESPLLLGDTQLSFDRSPDFFRRHRLQAELRIVVGEMEGRLVGITAAAIHDVRIKGETHRLAYIQHGRVHPTARRHSVASALVVALVDWARERGAEGPYWLISPANQVSLAFSGRIGGRWPVDVAFLDIDVADAGGTAARAIGDDRLAEAVALINAAHGGQELFEPLTPESLRRRLSLDSQYTVDHLRGVFDGERLAAVAGLWDWSAAVESIRVGPDCRETRTRTAAVLDWGHLPGRLDAFDALLRSLAFEARRMGRTGLTICEPHPSAVPDVGLPVHRWTLSLVTPTIVPPEAGAVGGLFADLVYV